MCFHTGLLSWHGFRCFFWPHTLETRSPAHVQVHICTCKHPVRTAESNQNSRATAEQEVVGNNRKFHKMVAQAFLSFFMELNNNMRTNKRWLYKLFSTLPPPCFHPSFRRSCPNMLTVGIVTFPKAIKPLNINMMCIFSLFYFFISPLWKLSAFICFCFSLLWNIVRCPYNQAKLWWIIDRWLLHQSTMFYTYLAFLNTEFRENRH